MADSTSGVLDSCSLWLRDSDFITTYQSIFYVKKCCSLTLLETIGKPAFKHSWKVG